MPSGVKYDTAFRERAVRLLQERRSEYQEESLTASIRQVAGVVGMPYDTLRTWNRQSTPGLAGAVSVDLASENRRLKRELAEAKRANEILRSAASFFAAELDRPRG
ncbi:hypothetical protein BHE16_04300 [Neomicrococcus aestuarii]|jgi:transposase|uniref:Transposase n=2 Tax=Neomicrococcus aestuarii TaxID=556325 RepID=A0A1L2ZMK8_9MICC|nr:transposase [Neomicrococcus aestuarii]APF40369.1 hypothetical protein BHE16_04300 [Neomicrococcus aestuarii]MBB5511726.1 transposase [Neomicrococcus aestuarii]MBB5513405.1 transposase [Neomicrococcus aestuarii]